MFLASVLKSFAKRGRHDGAYGGAHSDAIREAIALRDSGDVSRALDVLRGILSQRPDHGEAHRAAGVCLAQAAQYEEALPYLLRAATLMDRDPDVQLALGNVYGATGNREAAEGCYRSAIALAPQAPAGYHNLGLLLRASGDPAGALPYLERACDLLPFIEDAWRQRVLALIALERYTDAIAVARVATDLEPGSAALWSSLGYACQSAHNPHAGLECYERALALGAGDHELWTRIAMVYQEQGRMEEAIIAYEKAIDLKPDDALARFHLALARLSMRQYECGWDDYDLRLVSEDASIHVDRQRAWRDEPLAGHSIVVMGEQGLGDEIMFASCFREIIERAARCVITCSPRLEGLFRRSFPAATVLAVAPNVTATVADMDYQVAAGTLPRYMRRSAAAFPEHRGYLRADPVRVAYWKDRVAALGPGVKVGISWRGGTHKSRSPLRTLPLSDWEPIFAAAGVHFVSVQYGNVREDLDAAPADIAHWPDAIDDYDETAALLCALDLVISVCTAVIHLAGALGRPVWIMSPVSPEWRYSIAGDKMDWYPSSRMFRQREFGNWAPVVADVAREVQALAGHTHVLGEH